MRILQGLPAALLECDARHLEACLGGPTLVFVPGLKEPPLLVSVLLHGNETSGWNGLRRLLRRAPRCRGAWWSLSASAAAAAAGMRTLPHQQDYNRIWRGAAGPEGAIAAAVTAQLEDLPLLAAVDLHNNTGHNPHYAVVTDQLPLNLGLAYLFSDRAVYIREPDTVLTRTFAGQCPAVAVELGPVGDPRCDERAFDYLVRCLALDGIPTDTAALRLYRAEARVHVANGVEFSFADQSSDHPLVLTAGVEAVNFHELPPGTEFGTTSRPLESVLTVLDPSHRNVTGEYFEARGGRIVLRRTVVPAMYTTDPVVVRQDCLCYFMARMEQTPGTTQDPTDSPS